MSIEKAQEAYNKRMKIRKKCSKNLGTCMEYLAESLKYHREPTIRGMAKRQAKGSKFKAVLKSKAKSPKITSQLKLGRG